MRLKSHIFVASLIRSVFVRGGYAAVLRKGAEEAGAVFIRQRGRAGYETLYAPAPQNFFDEQGDTSRRFEVRLRGAEAEDVERALSSEIRFDPDCWIVELELDDCGNLFDVVGDRV